MARLGGKSVLPAPRPIVGSPASKQAASDMAHMIWKPLTVGALGTIAARWTVLPEANVEILGRQIPVNVAAFIALSAASWLGDVAHDKILPHISRDEKFLSTAGLLGPAAAGVSNLAVWSAASMDAVNEKGSLTLLALGAGSEIAGSWLYDRVLSGWVA